MQNSVEVLQVAKNASLLAGNAIKTGRLEKTFKVQTKSSKHDFLTDIDLKSNRLITETIKANFPTHQILSEETYQSSDIYNFDEPLWIIDPLDGTKNFIYDQFFVGVSIAYMEKKQLQVAVVNCPFLNEMFYAVRGEGAYLNDALINTNNSLALCDTILSSPFSSSNKANFEEQIQKFRQLYFATADTRRTGCTSIDLCSVACGRLGGYFTDSIYPWDIAAGSLIVKEAGGCYGSYQTIPESDKGLYYSKKIKNYLPSEIFGESYYACTNNIETELLDILKS